MYGSKDAGLLDAGARGPGRRFDQQQDSIVAQAGKNDVFAQGTRQQRNNALADVVNLMSAGGQIGNRRALRDRRRAMGVAWWQRPGRRQE